MSATIGVLLIFMEEKIAQAVEDRPALVDFYSAQLVRAVADEHVGAVVDGDVRQFRQEIRRL